MSHQAIAKEIADTLHALERSQRRSRNLTAKLHKLLEAAGDAVDGVDVAPLSAGGNKEPDPEGEGEG